MNTPARRMRAALAALALLAGCRGTADDPLLPPADRPSGQREGERILETAVPARVRQDRAAADARFAAALRPAEPPALEIVADPGPPLAPAAPFPLGHPFVLASAASAAGVLLLGSYLRSAARAGAGAGARAAAAGAAALLAAVLAGLLHGPALAGAITAAAFGAALALGAYAGLLLTLAAGRHLKALATSLGSGAVLALSAGSAADRIASPESVAASITRDTGVEARVERLAYEGGMAIRLEGIRIGPAGRAALEVASERSRLSLDSLLRGRPDPGSIEIDGGRVDLDRLGEIRERGQGSRRGRPVPIRLRGMAIRGRDLGPLGEVGRVDGWVIAGPEETVIRSLEGVPDGGGTVRVQGRIRKADGGGVLSVSIEGTHVTEAILAGEKGTPPPGDLEISGRLSAAGTFSVGPARRTPPSLRGWIDLDRLRVSDALPSLDGGRILFERGEEGIAWRLEGARLRGHPDALFAAQGSATARGSRVSFAVERLPIEVAARAAGIALPGAPGPPGGERAPPLIEGSVAVEGILEGGPGEAPTLRDARVYPLEDTTIRIPGLRAPIRGIEGTIFLGEAGTTVRIARAPVGDGTLSALVSVARRPGDPEGGILSLSIPTLTSLGLPEGPPAKGEASPPGEEPLQGSLRVFLRLDRVTGEGGPRGEGFARIEHARLAAIPRYLQIMDVASLRWPSRAEAGDEGEFRFRLEGPRVRIRRAAIQADPIRIAGAGTLSLRGEGAWDLFVAVQDQSRIPVVGRILAAGYSILPVRVTGPLLDPQAALAPLEGIKRAFTGPPSEEP